MLYRASAATAIVSSSFFLAAPVQSQELPAEASLVPILESALPEFWAVESLEIVTSSQAGDALTPRALIRYEAIASPQVDLMLESRREGPFVAASVTTAEGEQRTLFGVFDLTYFAGEWSGSVVVENPVDGLGQPRDRFLTPVVVLGSPDAEATISQIRESVLADARADVDRQLTELRERLSSQVTELVAQQQNEVQALQGQLAAQVAEAEARAAAEIRRIEERAERAVADLADVEGERAAALEAAQRQTQEEIDRIRAEGEAEITAIEADYAAQLEAVRVAFDRQLTETTAGLAAQEADLQRDWNAVRERIALLTADLEGINAEVAGLQSDYATQFTSLQQQRREFLSQFVGQMWQGIVECVQVPPLVEDLRTPELYEDNANLAKYSNAIYMNVVEANSNGLVVWIWHHMSGGGSPRGEALFQFQLRDSSVAFPLSFAASSDDRADWPGGSAESRLGVKAFDFEIDDAGRMSGTYRLDDRHENQSFECRIEVGR